MDPAGTAVRLGLLELGYSTVEEVRIGKYIELTLSAENEQEAIAQLDQICHQLLANPVIENYRLEIAAKE